MTLTAPTSTSPAVDVAVFGAADPYEAVRADDWVATVDPVRTGQIHTGLISVVIGVAGVLGVLVHGQVAGWWTLSASDARFGIDSLFALHQNLWAVAIALPLWVAVGSLVVPGQIGARRAAFPRLGNFALWGWLVGTSLLIAASFVNDGPQVIHLGNSLAPVGTTGQAPRATDIALAAVLLISLATLGGAANLVGTILTERAPGTGLATMRPFSWSVLVTMSFAVVTTPVFVAGTFLLYLDQHFGGQLFGSGSGLGAERIWVHAVWLFGRPEAILLAIPAVGAVADVIVHRTGKTLVGGGAANALIAVAAGTSLLTWAGRELIASTMTPPYARWWNAVILLPLFGLLLLIVGSLRGGLKPDVSLLGALGILLSIVAGAAIIIGIVATANSSFDDAETFAAQAGLGNLLVFGLVVLGAFTMVVEHGGATFRNGLPKPVLTLALLAVLGGVLLSGAALAAGAFGGAKNGNAAAAIGKGLLAGGADVLLLGMLSNLKPGARTHSEGGH